MDKQRKFLVKKNPPIDKLSGVRIQQAYLSETDAVIEVKVRLKESLAFVTFKKDAEGGRHRVTIEIPRSQADILFKDFVTGVPVEKVRYQIDQQGTRWEVDVFEKKNNGLILVETDDAPDTLPDWLGDDVTDDHRYRNSFLYGCPYSDWTTK